MKEAEKAQAKKLFLHSNLTQKDIAETLGVTEKTLGKWAELGGWEALRSSARASKDNSIKSMYILLDRLTSKNIELEEQGKLEYKHIHELNELVTTITELQGKKSLSNIADIIGDFMAWVQPIDLAFAQKLAEHSSKFLEIKSKEI